MDPKEEYLLGLGTLTSNHQSLELSIAFICWGLLGPDQKVGQIVTSQMGFSTLLHLASALMRYRLGDEGDLVQELEKLLTRAEAAESARNQMIHSAWASGEDEAAGVARIKFTARRKQGLRTQEDTQPLTALRVVVGLFPPLIKDFARFSIKLSEAGITSFREWHVD